MRFTLCKLPAEIQGPIKSRKVGLSLMVFNWFLLILVGYSPIHLVVAEPAKTQLTALKNLGNHHYPVSTSNPKAQSYFDLGLIQSYGFNHAEAAKSFRKATQIDPNCVMGYWGEALVLGPNINAPMASSAAPLAYAAIRNALSVLSNANEKEKALVIALSRRYSNDTAQTRSKLDLDYANTMREVYRKFPDDAVIASLFAESLMDLHPWDFWNHVGEAQAWTPEILKVLEHALESDQNNPLANHLYIHALEASPNPEKALPSAQRLPKLVPSSGHLVHMPAHIYIRLGRYRDAVKSNESAVQVDGHYLNHAHVESLYTQAYVPHNFHFLWAAAIKSGRKALAMQAAQDTASKVDPKLLHDSMMSGTLQHFHLIPLYTRALFGDWNAVLEFPEPDHDLYYERGIRHFARGLAEVRHKRIQNAEKELEKLQGIIANPAIASLSIFDLNSVKKILAIAEASLAGEIAASRHDYPAAVRFLRRAVEIEDELHYTEPKDWYLPSRQVLGAIWLEAGNPSNAEEIFLEDLKHHPQSGWSLFGLTQSQKAQGKVSQAEKSRKAFERAWQDADVELKRSRF